MTKIVLVSTSAPMLKDHPTGLWIEELAAPYYAFKDAKYEITLASPAGGPIPLDQNSLTPDFFTDNAKKFMHDYEAIGRLSHSVKLDTLDFASGEYDAIYMCGGHGTGTDFVNNPALKSAIETLYNSKKVVAAVCHGPICLPDCNKEDGTPLVQGLTVTGFCNTEEEAVQLTSKVPFLLETKLMEQGAKYEKVDDWNSKVCVDGNLVTGQNPQSSDECAAAVIKLLSD